MGEFGDGQRLQPDFAGAGEGSEEDAVSAEDHVTDAGDAGDLEVDVGLECSDMAGMDAEGFAGAELLKNDFAGELDPGDAFAADFLQQETVAAEDACTERLLEGDSDLDLRRGAEKAVAVDHEVVAGVDVDGQNVSGDAGSEGEFSGCAEGAVLGHEKGASSGYALECAEESSASGHLGVRSHLDGGGHPGKLASLGDDGLVRIEEELEDRHGGALDSGLHVFKTLLSSGGFYDVGWVLVPVGVRGKQDL